jgi:plastocyanin
MRLRRFAPYAAGVGALLLVSAPAAAAPRTYKIVIDKMKFGPVPSSLHKGDTIIWANLDFLRHSATATDHSFDVDLMPGKAAKIVLNKTGTIPFVCRYHPGMKGMFEIK